MDLKQYIREIADFPQEGINFYDVTTLLQDADALRLVIDGLFQLYQQTDVDLVVGTESRGFIFGAPLALKLQAGFVPVRKRGHLPYQTIQATYQKESGSGQVEMHIDAIGPDKKVLIVDDLLATGSTIQATRELVERLGGKIVGFAFVIELTSLGGREKLQPYRVESLLKYES